MLRKIITVSLALFVAMLTVYTQDVVNRQSYPISEWTNFQSGFSQTISVIQVIKEGINKEEFCENPTPSFSTIFDFDLAIHFLTPTYSAPVYFKVNSIFHFIKGSQLRGPPIA